MSSEFVYFVTLNVAHHCSLDMTLNLEHYAQLVFSHSDRQLMLDYILKSIQSVTSRHTHVASKRLMKVGSHHSDFEAIC